MLSAMRTIILTNGIIWILQHNSWLDLFVGILGELSKIRSLVGLGRDCGELFAPEEGKCKLKEAIFAAEWSLRNVSACRKGGYPPCLSLIWRQVGIITLFCCSPAPTFQAQILN